MSLGFDLHGSLHAITEWAQSLSDSDDSAASSQCASPRHGSSLGRQLSQPREAEVLSRDAILHMVRYFCVLIETSLI